MALGPRPPCGQCGKRTSNGAYGEPDSDFEGQWFCQTCWDAWSIAEEGQEDAVWVDEAQEERAPAPDRFSNRQNFGWGGKTVRSGGLDEQQQQQPQQEQQPEPVVLPPAPPPPPPPAGGWRDATEAELSRSRQVFRVLENCAVREHPDLEAKKVGAKSKGGNLFGGELTVDGWLKLHGERGWVLTDMRGLDGHEGVLQMQPNDGAQLAIEGYHSQGICCLEVVFCQVAVREYPSREAPQISKRVAGELVFARSQSFSGWVHLAGEPGWMLVSSTDFGQLLNPLYSLPHVDLWLLRDLWASARCGEEEMSYDTISGLKDAETKARLFAAQTFGHLDVDEETGAWKVAENAELNVVEEGLLTREDLLESHARILRKLFVVAVERALKEEPLRKLVPELQRCEQPALLHVREGDEEVMEEMQGPYGPTVLFEHQGRVFLLASGGLLLDPESQQFVGLWDSDNKTVLPPPEGFDPSGGVTMLQHEGKEYVLTVANGNVFDGVTRQRVGVYNTETQRVELAEQTGDDEGVKLRMAWDGPLDEGDGPADFEVPADVEACVQRADKLLERKVYRSAAREYEKALAACQTSSCVDLDEEMEIMRKRASCFWRLRDFASLLESAEKILNLDATDSQALEWQKMSSKEVAKRQALLSQRQ